MAVRRSNLLVVCPSRSLSHLIFWRGSCVTDRERVWHEEMNQEDVDYVGSFPVRSSSHLPSFSCPTGRKMMIVNRLGKKPLDTEFREDMHRAKVMTIICHCSRLLLSPDAGLMAGRTRPTSS